MDYELGVLLQRIAYNTERIATLLEETEPEPEPEQPQQPQRQPQRGTSTLRTPGPRQYDEDGGYADEPAQLPPEPPTTPGTIRRRT